MYFSETTLMNHSFSFCLEQKGHSDVCPLHNDKWCVSLALSFHKCVKVRDEISVEKSLFNRRPDPLLRIEKRREM